MSVGDSINVVSAFSEDQVERLTGISKKQLRYWDRTGFFRPAYATENRRVAFSRVYSFRDLVSLRILNVLRNQYSVPLQHLRQVAESLDHLAEEKWTATELFVLNKRVVFVEPGTDRRREVVGGQYVIGFPLQAVVSDTRRDVERMGRRANEEIGKFERKRNVSHNALVVAGTRIPVEAVRQFSDAGYSVQEILYEYPTLSREDVEAAMVWRGDGKAA